MKLKIKSSVSFTFVSYYAYVSYDSTRDTVRKGSLLGQDGSPTLKIGSKKVK